jgi:anti-sigma factor RsiW
MSAIPKSVISDLLPLLATGDVSAETRAFLEAELEKDASLRAEYAALTATDTFATANLKPPEDVAMRSFRRTRWQLALQRQLYAFAMIFTFVGLALRIRSDDVHGIDVHLMLVEMPSVFGTSLALGVALWIAYFWYRKKP